MRLYYPTSKTQPDAYLARPVRSWISQGAAVRGTVWICELQCR
jgi:hypothetical protein